MNDEKRNRIGYRTVTRMEEEERDAEELRTTPEDAAQSHFETGNWQEDAQQTILDEERMNDLLDKEQVFTNKKGLSRIRKQLILLWSYLKAIMSGQYTDYSVWAFVKATAGLLYVVSPFDLIPDFFPWVGWADDVLVVMYVCNLLNNELDRFADWQNWLQVVDER